MVRLRVCKSGIGDDDNDALSIIYHFLPWLSRSNYANFGSDTGGYRSGSRTGELLLRWAQVNSFSPLMENGGEGDQQPGLYGENVSEIYLYVYLCMYICTYDRPQKAKLTRNESADVGLGSIASF